jgi:hypothetical protein
LLFFFPFLPLVIPGAALAFLAFAFVYYSFFGEDSACFNAFYSG